MRTYLYIITMMLILTSCGSSVTDEVALQDLVEESDRVVVDFSVAMSGYEATRSTKSSWSEGDKVYIGYEVDDLLDDLLLYEITDVSTGALSPIDDDNKVYYIFETTNTYHAIYPYSSSNIVTSIGVDEDDNSYTYYSYIADLSDQTGDLSTIDLIYARSVVENQQVQTDISLNFVHQYALVTFNLTGDIEGSGSISLRGAYAKANFNIQTGAFEDYEVADISLPYATEIEVLMLPWQNMSNIELVLQNGDQVTIFSPDILDEDGGVVVLEANKKYTFTL